MEDLVVNGLDRQPIDFIAAKIKELGFNCVRLVFALDNLYLDPIINSTRLSANPELVGMTSMQVFDRTVEVSSSGIRASQLCLPFPPGTDGRQADRAAEQPHQHGHVVLLLR